MNPGSSLKAGVAVAGIAAALAILWAVEHNSCRKMQDENPVLRQQISQLSQPQPSPSVSPDADGDELEKQRLEHLDLLRLRGEVGVLRDAMEKKQRELAATQSENSQMAALSNALLTTDWGITSSNLMALKYVGVACRNYAATNGNLLPTSFDQIQNDKYIPADVRPNTFEFIDYGQPLPTRVPGYYFLARESQAILYPYGKWKRVYLLADGSVQIGTSDDGNFDSWEQQWIQQQSQVTGAAVGQ